MQLSDIYDPIRQDLAAVEDGLRKIAAGHERWLGDILEYALMGGGKRLRPALVVLSASFYDYSLPRILPVAMAVELMHLATLAHDDTIDNAAVRWGRPTVNKLWGMERAVLLGDYLFARSGELTASTENLHCIKLLPRTLMIITNGELAQAASAFKLGQTREQYYFRINCKTSALFIMATECGVVLSKAPESAVRSMRDYGQHLGTAFQIVDDILDFIGTEQEMGKPVGSDLLQGTVTLPTLMLIERFPDDNPVKRLFEGADKQQSIARAIEMVRNSSIIQDCFDVAADAQKKACLALSGLPDKPAREVLQTLAEFIVSRRR